MREPCVVMVTAQGPTNAARALAKTVYAEAKAREIDVRTYEGKSAQVVGKPWDKPTRLLPGNEAHELYGLLHRRAVLVLSFGQIYIARNPKEIRVARRRAATLAEFVRYKAVFRSLRHDTDITKAFEDLAVWHSNAECTGDADPRILPFHVFDADGHCNHLDDTIVQAQFRARFGNDTARTDAAKRAWSRASRHAMHGYDQLHVSLCELEQGMHWDVTTSRKSELANAREVWRFRSANDYVNVAPDGCFRGGGGASQAIRIWPKK